MIKLAVLCVLVAYTSAYPGLGGSRIVNGTNAKAGEIPYIVALYYGNSFNCAGSILNNRYVLTAAHCVVGSNPSSLKIQYGQLKLSSQENFIQVVEAYPHENYSPGNNYANDVAVLKLAEDIVYSDNVQPVPLPKQGDQPPGGNAAVISGWGTQKSGGSIQTNLQRVDIILLSDEDCKREHGIRYDKRYHVCAGIPGQGECNGDSGGPLTSNGIEWGVCSWSVKPCTLRGPGVFARVSSYIDWIQSKQNL